MICKEGDLVKKVNNAKEKIYRFILSMQEKNGYPPTVREICDGVGLSSPASVHRYLRILEDEGSLFVDPNKKRTYSVPSREKNHVDQEAEALDRVACCTDGGAARAHLYPRYVDPQELQSRRRTHPA